MAAPEKWLDPESSGGTAWWPDSVVAGMECRVVEAVQPALVVVMQVVVAIGQNGLSSGKVVAGERLYGCSGAG